MGLFKHTSLNRYRAVSLRTTASLLAASAGAVLLATASLPSMAAEGDEANAVSLGADAPAMVVQYGDLNLTTEKGVRTLLERIRYAADAVCPAADDRDLVRVEAHNQCVRGAVAEAVQHVGNGRLAAVHSGHARHG